MEIYEDSLGASHLLVVEPPNCDKNPTQNGCVKVPKGKWAEITFQLLNAQGETCQGMGLKPWRLEGVQMSMTAKDTSGTVTDEVRCDFDTDEDGNVQNETFSGKNMTIRDWNLWKYDVWYTVTAVSCDDPNEKITSDPWIENRG